MNKRIYRLAEVTQAFGISRASVYRLMTKNLFPRPIKIGLRAVGWDADDLNVWYSERKLGSMI